MRIHTCTRMNTITICLFHKITNEMEEEVMRKYEEPKLEVQAFSVEDVITASSGEIITPDEEI